MKKLISILLSAVLLFTLTACAGAKGESESALIECETEFIHLSYKGDLPKEPAIKVISTKKEFDAFYNETNENYYNTERYLSHLCEKYTEEFFESKSILCVLFDYGSSSVDYSAENLIKGADGKLYVNIKNTTPYGAMVTDDIHVWFAFMETEKQNLPESPEDIVLVSNYFSSYDEITAEGSFLEFGAERFYLADKGQELPILKTVKSVKELEELSAEAEIIYNEAGEETDFGKAVEKYTKDFFKKRALVFIAFDYDINAKRYGIDSVIKGADGKLYIDRKWPKGKETLEKNEKIVRGVFLELDKKHLPKNIEDIEVI